MKCKQMLLVLLAGLLVSGTAFAQRLPGGVSPEHYALTFAIHFSNNTFDGDETIDVKLAQPSSSITLNALEISFHDVTATAGGETQMAKVTTDDKNETATFTFPKPLPAGKATLHVKYTGFINNKLRGLYLSTYNGRKYAVSQMEATDARVAFPSFDEPAYKATFDISAIVDKADTAISNGEIVSDTPGPGPDVHTIKFSTSPKMSSYLVALTVGDWKCEGDSVDGIKLRVCTVPGKENLTHFPLEATKAIMHYYNQYYGIKYPLPKLDEIAVPDYEEGAMENWGAIVYRESLLLVDDATASQHAKEDVSGVIAHEMAHQWFGDLVTAQWWDDIWLNEGFATWMTPHPIDKWKPEWHESHQVVQNTDTALGLDATKYTRPIHQEAETRQQIEQLFDGIAYDKAAAVLHMLEQYVGPEEFRKGVNLYLKRHEYGNATAADFWNTMAEATHKPVNQIMPTFVMQAGEPIVSLKAKCNGQRTILDISQKRFFADKNDFSQPSNQVWQIPLCAKGIAADGSTSKECFLITKKEQQVSMKGCSNVVFPDAGALGYYHFENDATQLNTLGKQAEKALTPEERIALAENEWALVRAGQHKVGDYLNLTAQMLNTPGSTMLDDFFQHLRQINRDIVSDVERPQFEAWVRKTLSPALQQLGYEARPTDTPTDKLNRATAFNALGSVGNDSQVIAESKKLAQQYMNDPNSIDGSLAEAAIGVASRHGDAQLYEQFKTKLKEAKSPEQYYFYFYALTNFPDRDLLQRTLDWSLTPDVRGQDMYIVAQVARNPLGQDLAWNFLQQHFEEIQKKTGAGLGGVGVIFRTARDFCNEQQLQHVQKFFQEHPLPGTERSQHQTIDSIQACMSLRQQQQQDLRAWLNDHGQVNAASKKATSGR